MIHYFNPGHEVAVLNGSAYYMPPANIVLMMKELSFLPAWYALPGDYVYTGITDVHQFIEDYGNKMNMQVYPFSEKDISVLSSKLHCQNLCLWGISPQSLYFWEQISEIYNLNLVIPELSKEYKGLINRKFSSRILDYLIKKIPEVQDKIQPLSFDSLAEIETFINQHDFAFLAKAPYSSSGRGLLWLPVKGLTRTERQILHGILRKQGSISLEKVLNKKMDFAMEFIVSDRNVSFAGYSYFQTNEKGGYVGNYLLPQCRIENILLEFVRLDLLEQIKKELTDLIKMYIMPYYQGCVGVDMFIYDDMDEYYLHPCVEINMRYNMGYLSLSLFDTYICKESKGFFRVDFDKKGVYDNHLKLENKYPLDITGNKIVSGYLPLCPVDTDSKYQAYIIVDPAG